MPPRGSPAALKPLVRTASDAAPREAFGTHWSPPPGQPVPCRGCSPGLGRLQLCPQVRVRSHLRDPEGARRPRRARGLLRGIGQLAQARMAPGLAATPGRGLSPRATPPASGFVSGPAPPRHGLGGSEKGGPGSRRQRAGLGLPIVACPGGRAGWRGAPAVTARALGTEGRARGGARRARRGGASLEAAAGRVRAERRQSSGKATSARSQVAGCSAGGRASGGCALEGAAAGAASRVRVSPLPPLKVTAAPSG